MPPLIDPQAERLRQIHTIPALVKYLADELGWPVTVDAWEDAIFDWEPEELGLKAEHENAGKSIKTIKQLRPLVSNQPWGVFFVDFDRQQLPIVALRRVLNGLIVKRRTRGGGHQTWHAKDLLFISSFGEGTPNHPREIALAHFTDESTVGDLPTLRVLGWDGEDTSLELSHVARELKDKLQWPKSTATATDIEAWRTQWAGAFRLKYQQAINDSKSLAMALAELAKRVRIRVNAVLALENEHGHLRQLHQAFKDNLIADLTEDGFADMYAQTITYGLFAARASRQSGALVADDAVLMVPSTNPFLRDLLQDFLEAGGRAKGKHKRIDFDELGINDVVQTLRDVPMDAILRAFNSQKPGDDPVIHFYEDFLKAYDKKLRAKRGVFYTPRPVVRFIVRSVDEILKTEFGIEDGLASTLTWGEYLARPATLNDAGDRAPLTLPPHCTPDTPFVQILDPATGTATFLVEVIDHIHTHLKTKWRSEGALTDTEFAERWNAYVPTHLLPRLYGFELMMAPYAIAHMKIGLKLAETGYTFPEGGPRVNVFLTNALEPAHPLQAELEITAPMLAHEANAANEVKEKLAATVVVGNPPYSGESGNKGEWITNLMRSYLPDGADSYFRFNGAVLGERNPKWINNDYVKFLRLAQARLATLGVGVLGYITSNSYLDSPTFRGVRQSMVHTFPHTRILDLHGNANKGELENGDENVFEIKEGVAIFIGDVAPSKRPVVEHMNLVGSRQAKYTKLGENLLQSLISITPGGNSFRLNSSSSLRADEYEIGWPLSEIAPVNSVGIVTARDALCIHFTREQAWATVVDFASRAASDARVIYALGDDSQEWLTTSAQRDIVESGPSKSLLNPILYRPFDVRETYYTGKASGFMGRPQPEVMRHMLAVDNRAISLPRNTEIVGEYEHVFVAKLLTTHHTVSIKEVNYHFPFWVLAGNALTANLSPAFLHALRAGLAPQRGDEISPLDTRAPSAQSVFSYVYAILYSRVYRARYANFLRTDFPRIPIPASPAVFDALTVLGEELMDWHLLEHHTARAIIFTASQHPRPKAIVLVGAGTSPVWFGADRTLLKVAEKGRALAELTAIDAASHTANGSGRTTGEDSTDAASALGLETTGKVFINATSGFAHVRVGVWKHTIGGYQVLHKWLDDRRKAGRSLTDEDITHWLRVYTALEATQGLMQQVDAAIEVHGGWPDGAGNGGAFSLDHPPPDAATMAAEQATVTAQLKAQKRRANQDAEVGDTGIKSSGIGGTMSLFDPESDLDELAAASAGGASDAITESADVATRSTGDEDDAPALRIEEVSDWVMMCAVRAVLSRDGALVREDLIRNTAHELGFGRTGTKIADALHDAIRRAVRRGIAVNQGGELSLVSRTIEGYDRAFLKQLLVTCIGTAWQDKADLPTHFARTLGFARTGAVIEETVWSLAASLLRSEEIETDGRADERRYRRKKA